MKKLIFVLFVFFAFPCFSHHTGDSEYYDTKINGIGFPNGNSDFQFTIDHPSATNLVFTLDEHTGSNKDKLYSLILAAYTTGEKIKLITWGAGPVQVGDTIYVKARRIVFGREF